MSKAEMELEKDTSPQPAPQGGEGGSAPTRLAVPTVERLHRVVAGDQSRGARRLAASARNLPVVFSAAFQVHCQPPLTSMRIGISSITNYAARTE